MLSKRRPHVQTVVINTAPSRGLHCIPPQKCVSFLQRKHKSDLLHSADSSRMGTEKAVLPGNKRHLCLSVQGKGAKTASRTLGPATARGPFCHLPCSD